MGTRAKPSLELNARAGKVIFVEYIVLVIDVVLDLVGAIGRLISRAQGEGDKKPYRVAPLDTADSPGVRERD